MLVRVGIEQGFRDQDVVTLGDDPDDSELAEGLLILNAFWRTVIGTEFGENLADWPIPANTQCIPEGLIVSNPDSTWFLTLNANYRGLLKLVTATTLKFPLNPKPGARIAFVDMGSANVPVTLDGNGRLIQGSPTLVASNANQISGKMWFYRDEKASWELVQEFGLDDQFPIADTFDDLWITYLSLVLSGRNGGDPNPVTASRHADNMKRAKARYRQEAAVGISSPRVSETYQTYGGPFSSWMK